MPPIGTPPAGMPPGGAPPGAGATRMIGSSGEAKQLIVRWMGGSTQNFPLTKPIMQLGRAPDNDIGINHPAVSGHHLSLAVTQQGITITDLNSTNGTQLNGQKIPPGAAAPFHPGDIIRIGDLNGNWVGLALEGEQGEAVRTLALGKLDLSTISRAMIGRDPASYLPLSHPTVSFRHSEIFKQNNALMIRDLGSTNGTFVNGSRISIAPLKSGDVIQIGPFKLVYDAQQQSLAQSIGMGHRLDAVRLGREVSNKKMILNDVSLTINPGEFVALVGGSGAGKSTLMKALNGYEPGNHGQVLLDGEPFYPKLDLYRTQMGYVPQDDIIHRELPVRLALWYAAKLRLPDARPAEIEARINDALKAVDMVEHADKRVRVLSGGQRKRVSIAVELLARPSLFFLDEPTSGLDPGLEKKMMYDLNRLADEGRTVVLVTHATANIEQCDHVAFMSYGRLSFYGPPDEALKFFGVRDFSDIYLKLSQEVNASKGKPPAPEVAPFYGRYQKSGSGKVMSGVLWADAFRQSPQYQKYVTDRQSRLGALAQGAAASSAAQVKRAKDSFLRQAFILSRRQFDLIRLDWRTLFILLLMMPLIGILFASVSVRHAFKGEYTGTTAQIDAKLKEQLQDELIAKKKGESAENLPVGEAQTMVTMIALALTQGGTFAAAYEIVKERPIFKRERAVNLSVIAYILSKVLILGIFAIFQVASVLLVLGLAIDLDFTGAIYPSGALELFITLYLAVLASITFGLMISAIVPSSDVVLYAILVQLFMQIILSGTMFPLVELDPKTKTPTADSIVSYGVVGYWAMNAFGSSIDLPQLAKNSRICQVAEVPDEEKFKRDMEEQQRSGTPGVIELTTKFDILCDEAKPELYLKYEHTSSHLRNMWLGLVFQMLLWLVITIIVQARKKIE
jgi:ABC-type multidrug transport system ATPase subunit